MPSWCRGSEPREPDNCGDDGGHPYREIQVTDGLGNVSTMKVLNWPTEVRSSRPKAPETGAGDYSATINPWKAGD